MDLEIGDALSTGVMESLKGSIEEVRNYTRTAGANLPDIIRSWDNTLPTDNNLFSARRSQAEFISKKKADRAKRKSPSRRASASVRRRTATLTARATPNC